MNAAAGKVFLVGAGPGDPGLLTLRGQQLLERAEVVLYDYLVDQRVLRHALPDAELVCLGRHGTGRLFSQAEINLRMIAAALAGKRVVRLKGGDPGIFGRLAEELAALDQAEIAYEIVPGVTAALAASSYAGIPLTHRQQASCVAFVTGQESAGKSGESLDLQALADFPGTLVFYMGVTSAPDWARRLMECGKSADTPVAIVRYCSRPQQQVVRTILKDLRTVLAPGKMRPPAVIIVGAAAGEQAGLDWFAERPLLGQTVLVTRPVDQSEELVAQLAELGAQPLLQPVIEISPLVDSTEIDAAVARLTDFDWLVFSSANGVRHFLDRLLQSGRDLRDLADCKLAAIGPATAATLERYHLHVDRCPEMYRAEALAEELASQAAVRRFLLLRASRGREVLAESLLAAGGEVEQVVVYQSRDIEAPDENIATQLRDGEIDWVTVTSSAIARSLVRLFGKDLTQAKLAAISPLTAGVLTEAGFPPTVVATEFTAAGLLSALLQQERSSQ